MKSRDRLRVCRRPGCDDPIPWAYWLPLCAECRANGTKLGLTLAAAVAFVWGLLR